MPTTTPTTISPTIHDMTADNTIQVQSWWNTNKNAMITFTNNDGTTQTITLANFASIIFYLNSVGANN